MGVAEELAAVVRTADQAVGPSVVGIDRVGTGFVIEAGLVVTNAHNLRGGQVAVTLAQGTLVPGRVRGVDPDGDIAVVEADTSDAPGVQWSRDPLEVGSAVVALASPGGGGRRATFGLVSAVGRSFRGPRGRVIRGNVEHTAAMLAGSSGGPLADPAGKVVGINTHRLGDGFYLALPADPELVERITSLIQGQQPARPRLGIGVAPVPVARALRRAVGLPEAEGLLVRHVEEGSPAQRAGIDEGDLIVEAGSRPMGSADDLHEVIDAAAGGSVRLVVLRGTDRRDVEVVIGT